MLSVPQRLTPSPATSDAVYVFATSIATRRQARAVARHLSGLPQVRRFSFDLDDCDRVLRVVAERLNVPDFLGQLRGLGFACAELPD